LENSRREDAVEGEHRELRQRAWPLTVRAKGRARIALTTTTTLVEAIKPESAMRGQTG